jgi:hypothetical protein
MYLLRESVVGVGKVHTGGRDVVELLAVTRLGLGEVDDVEDVGATETGDLYGAHGSQARAVEAALPA